jgi:hypothetical protein
MTATVRSAGTTPATWRRPRAGSAAGPAAPSGFLATIVIGWFAFQTVVGLLAAAIVFTAAPAMTRTPHRDKEIAA